MTSFMKKLISIGMAISILGMASGCSGRASDIDIPSINNIELGVDYLDVISAFNGVPKSRIST